MAVYQSPATPIDVRERVGAKAVEALRAVGAVLADDFVCAGMPQIYLNDMTKRGGEPLDLDPFRGRMIFRANMNSSDLSHAPSGPVRLTLLRWGAEGGQIGRIEVGRGSDLDGTSIVSYIGVTIGQNVHFEPRVVIMDSDGHPADRTLPDIPENKKMAPVVIEDDAWIGYGATIMKGVTVGRGAVVAPGAVVMWNVKPGATVLGNPAKGINVFRKYFEPPAE
jgi:acetyltransferase-like isoleucine patch superfamily enzyme